jgi:ABC-type transport system involved in cytochrome c biogenesis permease component
MNQMWLIFKEEFEKLRFSEPGQHMMYVVMILCWSALLGINVSLGMMTLSTGWWLFFSVVITATLSTTVFVAELIQGALEILLTCGVSRRAILYGKILYCTLMSVAMGYACFALSILWHAVTAKAFGARHLTVPYTELVLYLSAAFFNTVFGAWMTIRLSSPRILYLLNMIAVAFIFGLWTALRTRFDLSEWWLIAGMTVLGLALIPLAERAFETERVIRPLDI